MKMLILLLEVILFILISWYLYLFFYRNSIETSMTFVAIGVQEEYDYTKNGFEEYNIISWENSIHGIFLDNKKPQTIYYFHGNGAPLSDYIWEVYDYSQSFFEYMKKEKWLKLENIIIFWHSIGTGVGTDFAFKNKVEKLILVSPLASRYDMSIKSFGFVLQKILFMKNSFDTYWKIAEITIPTLIIHGNKDEVIPYSQWKKVFENAGTKEKYFITLEGFWHNGIFENYGNELQKPIKDFLEKWMLETSQITINK